MDSREPRSKSKKAMTSKREKLPVRGRPAPRAARAAGNAAVGPDERHQMIAEAAYYRAEQRFFMNGDPLQDWLEAEAEITIRLRGPEANEPG